MDLLKSNTIIKNIYKLIPNEIIKYNVITKRLDKTNLEHKKFSLNTKSDISYVNLLEKKLENVISNIHPKEVTSAYLLSGGLDSSILVSLASRQNHKINTFTIVQKNSKLNEATYAKFISQI